MSIPSFLNLSTPSVAEMRRLLVDRIRLERRRTKESQQAFAGRCGIPLRTYKRFEQGQCDSLDAFLRIVIAFDRIKGFELMFPPKPVSAQSRNPVEILSRLRARSELTNLNNTIPRSNSVTDDA